ncbi:MAG TPA: hypothetical protein VNP72_03470 [Longimicrobium sp.]|nr:hypothetical protein [Longimicrobium sp.]
MSELMQWTEGGQIRRMSDDGTKPVDDRCRETTFRYLAGSGVTDAGGQWSMKVADAVCEQIGLVSAVSMVATPTFNPLVDSLPIPSYIQVGHTMSGGFVTLYARTWGCECKPQPHTPFDYHVAIAYDFVGAAGAK